jgi:hypothetical protein
MISTPDRMIRTQRKSLKTIISLITGLTARWFCSTTLFRYLFCRTLIGAADTCVQCLAWRPRFCHQTLRFDSFYLTALGRQNHRSRQTPYPFGQTNRAHQIKADLLDWMRDQQR